MSYFVKETLILERGNCSIVLSCFDSEVRACSSSSSLFLSLVGFFHLAGIRFGYKTEAMSKLFASISGTFESKGAISRILGVIAIQMNVADDIGSSQLAEEEKDHLREAKRKTEPF